MSKPRRNDSKSNNNFGKMTNWNPFDSTDVKAFPEITGYKLIKKIGKGANALVFKAIHEKTHQKVAIKVLKPSLQEDNDTLYRFRRELKVVSRLSHPHIIKIIDTKTIGEHCIVMEYLKYSLKDLLQGNGGKLPKKDALQITRKLAKALHYAHKKDVIHRDIKPANILFRQNREPVLGDFGLVKILNSESKFTKLFTIIGSPHYMSPEQCNGEEANPMSDIYSLGVVLFEMLSGKLPYEGQYNGNLWFLQHIDPAIPIPRLPSFAMDCQILIDCMMAKDKNRRINAFQVRLMIEELLGGKGSQKKWQQQYKFLVYLMAGLIVAFVILVILIFFLR